MRKMLVVLMGAGLCLAAQADGELVASATSPQTWMDTAACTNQAEVITVGKDAEPVKLAYSDRNWYPGKAASSVSITDNDTPVTVLSGEGIYEWVPSTTGTHTLKHTSGGITLIRTFIVEGPKVSIARGTDPAVNGGFSCAITSSAAGATIYFTTDGSEPTTESRVYTGPFAINPAMVTTVKAFCVAQGWPRSHTAMKLFMPAENMELVTSSDAGATFLDTRAGAGTLEAKESETIFWSALWSADANANVSVTVNGFAFVSGKGEGSKEWTPMSAGTYTFQHTTAGSDELLVATFSVAAKDIALAKVAVDCGDVTYSGSAYTPAIQAVTFGGRSLAEGTDYTLAYSGNVNAGTATITLTGKNLFHGTYTTNFTIKAKTLTSAMVGTVGNVTYTGSAHKPQPTVTDSARGVTLTKGTDYTLSWGANTAAGSGSVKITGQGNYTGTITKNFTIAKAEVTPPMISSKAYTGGLLRADVSATAYYTVANDGGVDAGNYPVTLTLTDTTNYRWEGGDSNPLALTFTITKATNAWITEPTIVGWTYGQAANMPNMGTAKFGSSTVAYSASPYNVGTYTATFTVPETANYTGLTKDVTFKITSAEAEKLQEIFDELPATVEPDGSGGWKVTITNDIDSSDLPIEIPDNLGRVTIDLNGHDLVGAGGADGDANSPGGDGRPAIMIVPGAGGGDVTRLAVVTTGGDSLVKGGDGGAGNPGGNGASAIGVADGAKDGVKIDVGAGVTVQGGAGGASTTGRGGDGGAGIDGNVGTNDGTILGGNGGSSVSGDGGDGGPGVDGNVDVNNGSITGGNGGDSEHGQGGDGGMGVTGNVGTNNGTIGGGVGGGTTDGTPGEDGPAVGGTVGGGTGTVRKVKVAVPVIPSAEYTGNPIVPTVPASGRYTSSSMSVTSPGSYSVMLMLTDPANYEWLPREGATIMGATVSTTFTILEPPPTIRIDDGGGSGAANSASYVGVYDGEGHGIDIKVTNPATGWTIRYAATREGPYSSEKPLYADVVSGVETWYEVSAAGFDPVTNVATVTITPRSLAGAALGSLRFEDIGGVRTPVPTLVDDLGHLIVAGNYVFDWKEEATGAMALSFTGQGNYFGLFEMRLAQTRFRVTFDANGGAVTAEGADYDLGTYYGVLPVPTRAGYVFDGWYENADFSGEPVTRNTEVIAADITLHAKWLRRALWYTDATFHLEGAATYDGYLIDPAAGDVVAGTISTKAGKPGKNGLSKLTVTILLAGERKMTLKTTTFDGKISGEVGGRHLDLALGFASMSGTLGRYAIDGARNVFAEKDADSRLKAAQALKRWQGTYVTAWQGAAGWNGLSLAVKAKGKTKVTGTLADGTKVSAATQLLVGERECAIAVSWTKKSASAACLLWLREDGTVECGNLPGGVPAFVANTRTGANLVPGAAFRVDSAAVAAAVPGLLADLLPDGLAVRMKGTQFDIDKAGTVKLLKDKSGIDSSGLSTNPSGLKLKYTAKDGTFKGAFTAYTLGGGKLKKTKVQVSGVVLGGKGYGTASVKNVGSWPVLVE